MVDKAGTHPCSPWNRNWLYSALLDNHDMWHFGFTLVLGILSCNMACNKRDPSVKGYGGMEYESHNCSLFQWTIHVGQVGMHTIVK